MRRDLRLEDNHGLFKALSEKKNVQILFIFDKHILDKLDSKLDKRLIFIHDQLEALNAKLSEVGSSILTYYGFPEDYFKNVIAGSVYTNEDYEPYARKRDHLVADILKSRSIVFKTFKDHVIFAKDEVVKDDGSPYSVYTPFSRKWKITLDNNPIQFYPSENFIDAFAKSQHQIIPLKKMGFEYAKIDFPNKEFEEDILNHYEDQRNFPAVKGTSRLSVHFRFGTISIRKATLIAKDKSSSWLNELIWRNFYMIILWHFPEVEHKSFKPAYDNIHWRNNEIEFNAWCEGKTGYPIVDAGMRELNETGFMHNRVRMITASFLSKHLLIDWRWGEAYFAKKLLDYELASNNGGWQWAAGSGCDAAPYFRVFNPDLQTKKFDPELKYIKKWVPEFQDFNYKPVVEHKFARERALETYKSGLNS